ncbi:MAG: GIY-YIG nuclease family protein [Thermodesulfobacteriota bacterium]|nr:GIY-YIG nuclease family protein [Thermodesulfobacteriota bacterium]
MNEKFTAHIEALKPRLDRLLAMEPVTPTTLPSRMPRAGIYLISEGGRHLYVGRSNNIRRRIGRHCRPGATHRMAAFAFRLAREATGNICASYKKGDVSRIGLMQNSEFVKAFDTAKARIRAMSLRFVEEADPVRQALLEIYTAVVLDTPYNDFDTH